MKEILIEKVAREAGVTKGVTARVIKAFTEVIPEMITEYGHVRVTSLGTFSKRLVKPRLSQDPFRHRTIQVGWSANMHFKPARNVKRYASENWLPEED